MHIREFSNLETQQSKKIGIFLVNSSITIKSSLRGTYSAVPRLVVDVIRSNNVSLDSHRTYVGAMSAANLRAHVEVPVETPVLNAHLVQTTEPGWNRELASIHGIDEDIIHPSILLSSRNHWNLTDNQELEVFERAIVIDGARRLAAAYTTNPESMLPITVVLGLSPEKELRLRQKSLRAEPPPVQSKLVIERVETATPRLRIEDFWVEIEIRSNPFVVCTNRGYAPALLVRRDCAATDEHILIGAQSLTQPLELLRTRNHSLKGLRVRIRKESLDRTAQYRVLISDPR